MDYKKKKNTVHLFKPLGTNLDDYSYDAFDSEGYLSAVSDSSIYDGDCKKFDDNNVFGEFDDNLVEVEGDVEVLTLSNFNTSPSVSELPGNYLIKHCDTENNADDGEFGLDDIENITEGNTPKTRYTRIVELTASIESSINRSNGMNNYVYKMKNEFQRVVFSKRHHPFMNERLFNLLKKVFIEIGSSVCDAYSSGNQIITSSQYVSMILHLKQHQTNKTMSWSSWKSKRDKWMSFYKIEWLSIKYDWNDFRQYMNDRGMYFSVEMPFMFKNVKDFLVKKIGKHPTEFDDEIILTPDFLKKQSDDKFHRNPNGAGRRLDRSLKRIIKKVMNHRKQSKYDSRSCYILNTSNLSFIPKAFSMMERFKVIKYVYYTTKFDRMIEKDKFEIESKLSQIDESVYTDYKKVKEKLCSALKVKSDILKQLHKIELIKNHLTGGISSNEANTNDYSYTRWDSRSQQKRMDSTNDKSIVYIFIQDRSYAKNKNDLNFISHHLNRVSKFTFKTPYSRSTRRIKIKKKRPSDILLSFPNDISHLNVPKIKVRENEKYDFGENDVGEFDISNFTSEYFDDTEKFL